MLQCQINLTEEKLTNFFLIWKVNPIQNLMIELSYER